MQSKNWNTSILRISSKMLENKKVENLYYPKTMQRKGKVFQIK